MDVGFYYMSNAAGTFARRAGVEAAEEGEADARG